VRGNSDGDACFFGSGKQLPEVIDHIVLHYTLAEYTPAHTFGAEEVDLRVDDHQCCAGQVELHARVRQRRLCRVGIRGGGANRIVAHDS